jgi:hypothetical protein
MSSLYSFVYLFKYCEYIPKIYEYLLQHSNLLTVRIHIVCTVFNYFIYVHLRPDDDQIVVETCNQILYTQQDAVYRVYICCLATFRALGRHSLSPFPLQLFVDINPNKLCRSVSKAV